MYYLDGIVKEEKENDVFLRVPKRSQQLDCLDQATPNENSKDDAPLLKRIKKSSSTIDAIN